MKFKCSICEGWNTYVENVYSEGSIGVCYDCREFFIMGKSQPNWTNIRNFLILFIATLSLLVWVGVIP